MGQRIGADPARAVLEVVGGQGPQHLVNEFAHAIAAGETGMALLVGSEAISTVRHLMTRGETRDWAESVGGQLEDRGLRRCRLMTRDLAVHGARTPIQVYALFENARRARLGMDRDAYAAGDGRAVRAVHRGRGWQSARHVAGGRARAEDLARSPPTTASPPIPSRAGWSPATRPTRARRCC